jgi:PII-like signaling protein
MPDAESYAVIEIFTSEQARSKGHQHLYEEIAHMVAKEDSRARCVVTRAVAGCYEDGEIASHRVLDLSYNMPLKIEIILPACDLDRMLERLRDMVSDGIVTSRTADVQHHAHKHGHPGP